MPVLPVLSGLFESLSQSYKGASRSTIAHLALSELLWLVPVWSIFIDLMEANRMQELTERSMNGRIECTSNLSFHHSTKKKIFDWLIPLCTMHYALCIMQSLSYDLLTCRI